MSLNPNHDPRAVSIGACCRGCGAEIVWVTMESGKRSPCDPELVEGDWKQTLVVVHTDPKGNPAGKVFPKAPGSVTGRVSHFATCSTPERFRDR